METALALYDYEGLRTCPFCEYGGNLISAEWSTKVDRCAHCVVSIQSGAWARDICPPVTCDGHFFRSSIVDFLADVSEVVCKWTPGTRRHPEIRVFYHPDPAFVTSLRLNFKLEPVDSIESCGTCGGHMFSIDRTTCEQRIKRAISASATAVAAKGKRRLQWLTHRVAHGLLVVLGCSSHFDGSFLPLPECDPPAFYAACCETVVLARLRSRSTGHVSS